MYKPLLVDKILDKKEGMAYINLKTGGEHITFTGEFEANILCQECENKISRWEAYAYTVLYGGILPKGSQVLVQQQRNQHGAEFLYVQGLDYKLFKLFLLSILWRASISSRPFFKYVSLGSFEEKIRQMLMSEDPGAASAYPCFISTYKRVKLPTEVVGEPRKVKSRNGTSYAFLIHGTLYYFFVSHKIKKPWILEAAINEKGELRLVHIPEQSGKKLLNSYFGKDIFK